MAKLDQGHILCNSGRYPPATMLHPDFVSPCYCIQVYSRFSKFECNMLIQEAETICYLGGSSIEI